MSILLALLLSISSNLDNIIFGITYGASNVQIPIKCATIISCITTIITGTFMVLGMEVGELLNAQVANVLGGILLVLIGFYYMIDEIVFLKKGNTNVDKIVTVKSMFLIAINLSINNIPIAIAGGISNTNIFYTVIFSFIFSSIFMYLGNVVGRKVKSKIVSVLASILLIILGIIKCV